ncbi:MAG: cytochrome c-type biogenesis protein CcmH [Minwuia sp.]|nr:cytochrome c-type biogenesis protein CcmH [Minwuia sp.]
MSRSALATLIGAALLILSLPAFAIFTEKPLADPEQEARAQHLMREFRCLVCQNQAISESHADLAGDMRAIVRERIAAGDDNDAVRQYFIDRYGDWVLLDPPLNRKTILLWAGGGVILLVGVGLIFIRMRRSTRAGTQGQTTLSDAEKAELERLMREQG